MRKNIFHKDLSPAEIIAAKHLMKTEMADLDYKHPVRYFHMLAWESFERNEFSFDGPTFVHSRFKLRWEVASFIHDWRNSAGYVGAAVDNEFFSVMIALNYPVKLFFVRYWFTRLTFINVIKHRLQKNYKDSKTIKLYQL